MTLNTNGEEYPTTEEPFVQVLRVRFFTLPEETREVFRTNQNVVVSDPLTDPERFVKHVMADSHKMCLHGVVPVVLRWTQEFAASVVHETPAVFAGGDCVASWP